MQIPFLRRSSAREVNPGMIDAVLINHRPAWKDAAASAMATLHTYGLSEWDRLNRAIAAKEAGVPMHEYAKPYGSQESNTTINQGGGFLKGALATLLATALGGASVFGLSQFLGKKPAEKPQIENVIDNTKGVGVDYEAELIPPRDE